MTESSFWGELLLQKQDIFPCSFRLELSYDRNCFLYYSAYMFVLVYFVETLEMLPMLLFF